MDELTMARRMAGRVLTATLEYISRDEDFARVVKRKPRDVTRKVDMVAEEALDAAIVEEGISARVVSEEVGERLIPAGREPEYTLVFDPLDGSNNAVAGIPYFCTSLAIARRSHDATFGDIDAAAIASACCGTFSAGRGQGAFLDGARISAGHREGKPAYAIYAYGVRGMPRGLIALQEEDCFVRTLGSIALDICMVARRSFDAVIDTRSRVSGYDIMAGGLVLLEAGGVITRSDGQPLDSLPVTASGISFVASSDRAIHDRLLNVVNI